MRLTKQVFTRVILLALLISVGIWLLYEPKSGVTASAAGGGISANWSYSNNLVTDEDGEQWRCENPKASNPDDMGCVLASQPGDANTVQLNHHMSIRNAAGQWLIFERRGNNGIIDANGTFWECSNRDQATTLSGMGCVRSH